MEIVQARLKGIAALDFMTPRFNSDEITEACIKAASLIVDSEEAPTYLIQYFEHSLVLLVLSRIAERKLQKRSEVRKRNRNFIADAKGVIDALNDPSLLEFADVLMRRDEIEVLIAHLSSLSEGLKGNDLNGVTSDKAHPLGTVSSKRFCALIIAAAWRKFHPSKTSNGSSDFLGNIHHSNQVFFRSWLE